MRPGDRRPAGHPHQERSWLSQLGPAAVQLSTLAWAGARNSTRGQELFRGGAVGRLSNRELGLQVLVRASADTGDDEAGEVVQLALQDGAIASQCTCGVGRCAHAVAAVLEVQRRGRVAADSARTQDAVMGALRQRLQVRADPQESRGALLDLQRLPLDAAVDMVALTWRQSLRPAAPELRDLEQITQRIVEAVREQPALARQWAVRMLTALGVRKVVFTPLPEAAEVSILRLAGVFDYTLDANELPFSLAEQALDGHPQVAPAVAHALVRLAGREAQAHQALAAQLLQWRSQQPADIWHESGQPTGRDVLFSGLVELATAQGDLAGALRLAMAWPPMRSTLVDLAQALGKSAEIDGLVHLLGWYDPRGGLWQAGANAGVSGADAAGNRTGVVRLANWAFERQPVQVWLQWLHKGTPAEEWPQRRAVLLDKVLTWEDPLWLPAWLAAQSDAVHALLEAVVLAPLRDGAAASCIEQLERMEPLQALLGREVRMAALSAHGSVPAKKLRQEATALLELAERLGEPGLAKDYLKLLVRERADPPLVQALAAVV